MQKIKITKNIDIDEIEEMNRQLIAYLGQNLDLEIPLQMEFKRIGILPVLFQLIGSWLRYYPNGNLYTNFDSKSEKFSQDIEDYLEDEVTFLSIILAWKRKIFDVNNIDIKYKFKDPTTKKFNRLKFINSILTKGNKLFLPCFDGIVNTKGLLDVFYTNNETFVSEGELAFTLQNAISNNVLKTIQNSETAKRINEILIDCTAIIYELMDNTHSWARKDITGIPLYPNTRGLYMQFHRGKKERLINDYKNYSGMSNYFKHDLFKPNTKDEIYFIELSIFDIGPGLIKRFTGGKIENLSIAEQINIIKLCLSKGISSLKNNKGTRGFGLQRMLNTINNKGFLKIRTSDKCVCRDLIEYPFDDEQEIKESIKLFDWQTNSISNFISMPKIEGTTITIVYPLIYTEWDKYKSLKEFNNE